MSREREDTHQETSLLTRDRDAAPSHVDLRQVRLELLGKDGVERVFVSEAERTALGSHPSNDLVLDEPTVSRFHCELSSSAKGVRIRDLGSTNGTFVDGVRVFDAILEDGSRIQLGSRTLRLSGQGTIQVPLPEVASFGELSGESEPMRRVFEWLSRIAASDATVLIEGETGTGKEGAAEALHLESARRDGPFVIVDCAAIPQNLIESELFGHEKGAFTGATERRSGAFEHAHGGTIVLDEIGELPSDLQPKLLRVLEQKTIRRIGSSTRISVDLRIVACTNRDLRREVNEGRFRSDLYYRLSVVKVVLPPLRERLDDLPLLSRTLLARLGAKPPQLQRFTSPEFLERLRHGAWPGNIRELRNYLERCLVLDDEAPMTEALSGAETTSEAPFVDLSLPYSEARRRSLAEFERIYLSALLEKHGGNVSRAAREAGIERVYLHRLLRRSALRGEDR